MPPGAAGAGKFHLGNFVVSRTPLSSGEEKWEQTCQYNLEANIPLARFSCRIPLGEFVQYLEHFALAWRNDGKPVNIASVICHLLGRSTSGRWTHQFLGRNTTGDPENILPKSTWGKNQNAMLGISANALAAFWKSDKPHWENSDIKIVEISEKVLAFLQVGDPPLGKSQEWKSWESLKMPLRFCESENPR